MTWDAKALTRFWKMVAERHEIFRRRVLLKQPPPWTADPVLHSVAITNVYRDLDRTTREFLHRVPPGSAAGDLLFNIVVFRYFTWTPTYDALGGFRPAAEWAGWWAAKTLRRRRARGEKLYTGAFMVRGGSGGAGGKTRTILHQIGWVKRHIGLLIQALLNATTSREAHHTLTTIPGVGGFLGAEILIDACYPEIGLLPERFLNEWIFIGPGALRGLTLLTGRKLTRFEADVALADLQVNQRTMLKMAGTQLNGPRLTLENLENCSCEFSKYERARTGGHVKRGYRDTNPDLSPWDDIPAKYRDAPDV